MLEPLFVRAYALAGPLHDLVVACVFLPVGGGGRVGREIASWLETSPGERLLAPCCGTGSMERAILDLVPSVSITGADRGRGPSRTARWKNRGRRVAHLRADPSVALPRFPWVPGNPEAGTIRDLDRHGLDNEMREAGGVDRGVPRAAPMTETGGPAAARSDRSAGARLRT